MSKVPLTRGERWAITATVVVLGLGVVLALVGGSIWLIDEVGNDGRCWDCGTSAGARQRSAASAQPRVVKVVDGDTIEVELGGRTENVRLLGIDTPETKDPRKPVQCFGAEASAHTAELLPPGTEVRLVPDVERRDRYDRVLAYVYRVSDGLFVNLELARDGYADLLTYPPNVAHTAELSAAVAEARREQRGLWQACGGPGRPA
jgi:micrococcal nuclease